MWQCMAQSPSASATNSTARVAPTSTVLAGNWAASGTRPASICGDAELVAVQMDGVVIHRREVSKADANALAFLDDQRRGGRVGFAVYGENIKFDHFNRIWAGRARIDSPFREQQAEITINTGALLFRGIARMDDEHAHHAQALLGHLVEMGVVHVGAGRLKDKFIFKGLAGGDRLLSQAIDPIHSVGKAQAVPVNGCGGGEVVGDVNPNTIALDGFRSWDPASSHCTPSIGRPSPGANSCCTGSAIR